MWCLPWDPWLEVSQGHTHARCGPPNFKRYSYEIQRHLENAFPDSILIEWGDGIDGFSGRLLRSRGFRAHFPEDFPECCRALPAIDISDLLLDVRSQLGLQLFHAIERADEDMVLRLMAEDQLDINFIARFGPERVSDNGKRHFVRKVSAVRLAVEQLVDSVEPVDHPEVASQFRILHLVLFKEPKLEFPKLCLMNGDDTEDVARHVAFDAVGNYEDTFVPMQSGHAEVRIRMTLLELLLPRAKRSVPLQRALQNLQQKELDWLLAKKPGWQLVKVLQEVPGVQRKLEALVPS